MPDLRAAIDRARREKSALGHFNVSDLVAVNAVIAAARAMDATVLIGVSEGEREFLGTRRIAALVRSIREDTGLPVFVNADHTHSLAGAEEAARAGFDAIVFDASALDFDANATATRRAVEAIKSIDEAIVVEGEIGYIGASSAVLDARPEGVGRLTTPEEARQFVQLTDVDVLSPAVGNMHGMLRKMVQGHDEKRLDVPRIAAIAEATGLPLTLHGASGTNADDLMAAIQAGISIVHVNTELRLAWRHALDAVLRKKPDEIAPYKILPEVVTALESVVVSKLRLFRRIAATDV